MFKGNEGKAFGRAAALLLAVLALALLAAGCGGGDDDGTTSAAESGQAQTGGEDGSDAGGPAGEDGQAGDGGQEGGGGEGGGESGQGQGQGGDGEGGSAASGSGEGGSGDGGSGGASNSAGEGGSGDGGSGGNSGAAAGKSQLISQGDAICEGIPANYQRLLGQLPTTQQQNQRQSVPKAAVPPLEQAAEEFAALKAPAGDQGSMRAIAEALESAAADLTRNPTQELTGPQSPLAEFTKLTREYGFQLCPNL